MQNATIGNFEITYPDTTAYLHDNLLIKVRSVTNQPVGAQIQLTDLASGNYRKLKYLSELSEIVFVLNDSVSSLYHDALSYNVTMRLYENGVYTSDYGFDFDIMNGRTLPLRRHGSELTIYMYRPDDLYKVGLILPASGGLSINDCHFPVITGGYKSLDLRGCVTDTGEYNLCYDSQAKGGSTSESEVKIVNIGGITPFSASVQLQFADTSGDIPSGDKGGGVWDDDKFFVESYCIKLIYQEVCDDYNFFLCRYLNTDGIMRYLGGKIKDETVESKGENFYRMDVSTPIRDISRRYLTESADTVKVAYGELRRDSYWNDILLADKVEFLNYNGEWFECSVKTSKVTVTSEEYQDVELEFEILKG